MKILFYVLSFFTLLISGNSLSQEFPQVCDENIQASTPLENFTIHADGTVTDNTTELMWMRCTFGQGYKDGECIGNPAYFFWNEALNTAEQLEYATYSDWRLPNIKELLSIVEDRCSSPILNLDVFPNTGSWAYWSSTVKSNTPNSIFQLYLFSGDMGSDPAYYVPYSMRLVRFAE
jgi:hypothetical protein